MTNRQYEYVYTGSRPVQIDSMDQSRFWQRLDDLSCMEPTTNRKTAIDHLKASIRKVTVQAKWISDRVCCYMPQYTLHEERHFLNVLAIMDALVPDEVITQFGPLDCGMPILAAYTHDLGMALSSQEREALHDESTTQGNYFASYRNRFGEELRQVARWKEVLRQDCGQRKSEVRHAQRRIDAIEGHILASYLRDTHTEEDQIRRLRHWLDAIKRETGDDNLFNYGNFNYQRTLALVGISHGRNASWLRNKLNEDGPEDRFFQTVGNGESANMAFTGLLLRLADVLDFDASRAPRILFKHFGIDNEKSVLEWNKHLSVLGWRLDVDPDGKRQPDLLYSAECQHPVHEKTIRDFKRLIDTELSAVRIELDAQCRQLPRIVQPRYDMHLPSQTRLDIRPTRDSLTDEPKYVYHDLQFQLDQGEIQQLLMGESLYGDRDLCVRELLQNALDALELRELRLKMKQKGGTHEPVDGELTRPGWVREPNSLEEELRATLTWGTDEASGQHWLRVTDNGVGMTEDVIKDHFTQIGKSYYRSPEFNEERAAMKAAGEVVSPISVFGIGILSCFMIADRLVVRTNPGARTDEQARDINISGPGSVFWIQKGTRELQGTEITLYLKSQFSIRCEDAKLRECVLHALYEGFAHPDAMNDIPDDDDQEERTRRREEKRDIIDPALTACVHVIWPKHPVCIVRDGQELVRIDDQTHMKWLLPIDLDSVRKRFHEWGHDQLSARFEWHFWDWTDQDHKDATGTRIRLWYTSRDSVSPAAAADTPDTRWEVAALTEPEPEVSWGPRERFLINGMHVERFHSLPFEPPVYANIGSRVWFDFRGIAAPSLTADRRQAFVSQKRSEWEPWREILENVWSRWNIALKLRFASSDDWLSPDEFAYRFDLTSPAVLAALPRNAPRVFDFSRACMPCWLSDPMPAGVLFAFRSFLLELDCVRMFRGHHSRRDKDLLRGPNGFPFPHGRYGINSSLFSYTYKDMLPECSQREEAFAALAYWHADQNSAGGGFFQKLDFGIDFTTAFPLIDLCLQSSILQEAFFPELSRSWAPLGMCALRGAISDGILQSPGQVRLETESDDRTLRFSDPSGVEPTSLVERGYDVCFPMTAVPIGKLRRDCAQWRSDRHIRQLGVAPFLLPHDDSWTTGYSPKINFETFGVSHIWCLIPRFELWSKSFADWTEYDWNDPENLSALWDLSGEFSGTRGKILWTRGAHNIDQVAKIGLVAPDFLKAYGP